MNPSPETWMVIGGALIGLVLFGKPLLSALNPAFVEGVKTSSWNPMNWFSKGGSSSTDDIHGLVAKIMGYFQTNQDTKGLMLAVSIGQHVYQQQVDNLTKSMETNAISRRSTFPMESSSPSQEKP